MIKIAKTHSSLYTHPISIDTITLKQDEIKNTNQQQNRED